MNLELVEAIDADNPIEGDIRLDDGQMVFVDGPASVAQHLRNRLRFFRGEWFRDRRQGTPYYERVLVKGPSLQALRIMFRRIIVQTPGIAAVDRIELSLNSDREATLSFEAQLASGDEPLVFEDFIVGEVP